MTNSFMSCSEVQKATSLSRASLYRRMEAGTFPKPHSLGGRRVGWLSSDIQAWIDQQVKAA